MEREQNETLESPSFLFMIDGEENSVGGLICYGDAIRTSGDCSEALPDDASNATVSMKWMTIYSDDGTRKEHHALVWHNACFAF
jgi:hypothetical protein